MRRWVRVLDSWLKLSRCSRQLLGVGGAGYSLYSFGPLLFASNVSVGRKVAGASLIVASFFAAQQRLKYAREARLVSVGEATTAAELSIRLFHKDNLKVDRSVAFAACRSVLIKRLLLH